MADNVQVIAVPLQLEEELRQAIAVLRQEIKTLDPNIRESDIVLERQEQKGMLGEMAGEVLLYVGGAVATGITQKWVEEILWPKVKPLLKKYSNEILDLLQRIAKGGGKNR